MNIDTQTLFSALSNDIRSRLLVLLQLEGELCVCELTHALELSQPMISRHLGLLRKTGIITDRRQGLWVYYSINNQLEDWIITILETTAQANKLHTPFDKDIAMLKEMTNRPERAYCN